MKGKTRLYVLSIVIIALLLGLFTPLLSAQNGGNLAIKDLIGKKLSGNWLVHTGIFAEWRRPLSLEFTRIDLEKMTLDLIHSAPEWGGRPAHSAKIKDVSFSVDDQGIRISFKQQWGEPMPPLEFRIYKENSKWQASSIRKGRDPRATVICTLTE